jgi:hypothetical protein
MNYFKGLKSYKEYLKKNPFYLKLGINLKSYGRIDKKIIRSNYYSVNPNLKESFTAELDDLVRLHYLIISRKVKTVLEFGVGKSTVVFDDALKLNKKKYHKFVMQNLRSSNPFQCFSIDNNKKWISYNKKKTKTDLVKYHYSECITQTFNDRICTFYKDLPNITPDLIYIDAPDQFSPKGNVRGINTHSADRLPMSADILAIEHFLHPGTLIVLDGRTANARFLHNNFQRNWYYYYSTKFDQHFFELLERPLGIYNKKQIDFSLGKDFYLRIKKKNQQKKI